MNAETSPIIAHAYAPCYVQLSLQIGQATNKY